MQTADFKYGTVPVDAGWDAVRMSLSEPGKVSLLGDTKQLGKLLRGVS